MFEKSMHFISSAQLTRRVTALNASNPDAVAPAAARTAKLMKNANSLTELYAGHFAMVVELETKNAELKEAEAALAQVSKVCSTNCDSRQQETRYASYVLDVHRSCATNNEPTKHVGDLIIGSPNTQRSNSEV